MKMKRKSLIAVTFAIALMIGIPTAFIINSAVQTDSSMKSITAVERKAPVYSVNEQGQTYGQAPYPEGPEQEPDLILTEGENGVIGYAKASDLNSSVSSPSEAINYQKSMESAGFKSVPLYKSDGKTVIGEFRMYYSNGD